MPNEEISCLPNEKLMQASEIFELAKIFVGLGVRKIRLTGGEPLVRKEFAEICRYLAQLPVELTLTTNGTLVHKHLELFKEVGIRSINVSIDTLDRNKFIFLTKRDAFDQVWKNIELLLEHGFSVKLNMVVMKGVNDAEVIDFVSLTKTRKLHVRFIEFMPFDSNGWSKEKVVRSDAMLQAIDLKYDYIKLQDFKHDTAKKYKLLVSEGSFAFITTMSQLFCVDCNRMRLTADGKIKNCLFGKDEMDLLGAHRANEDITSLIKLSIFNKHKKMGGQFEETILETDAKQLVNRSMIKIGG